MDERTEIQRDLPRPILLAGPTASGKSGLALRLAERLDAWIVNADALQIYREWRVLTARPSPEDEARARHLLYGEVAAADTSYSAGRWLRDVTPILETARRERRALVIVGGTGLYFKALTEGLAEIPPTPPEIRAQGEALLQQLGPAAFAAALADRDPASAERIDMANPRRVLRAYEVLETTGRGFADWMAQTPPAILPLSDAVAVKIEPDRTALRGQIAARFRDMMETGALDEAGLMVEREAAGEIDPDAPALKALGYAPLKEFLAGAGTRGAAIGRGILETTQYAKRQSTWLRNQMKSWRALETADTADIEALARATTHDGTMDA